MRLRFCLWSGQLKLHPVDEWEVEKFLTRLTKKKKLKLNEIRKPLFGARFPQGLMPQRTNKGSTNIDFREGNMLKWGSIFLRLGWYLYKMNSFYLFLENGRGNSKRAKAVHSNFVYILVTICCELYWCKNCVYRNWDGVVCLVWIPSKEIRFVELELTSSVGSCCLSSCLNNVNVTGVCLISVHEFVIISYHSVAGIY